MAYTYNSMCGQDSDTGSTSHVPRPDHEISDKGWERGSSENPSPGGLLHFVRHLGNLNSMRLISS